MTDKETITVVITDSGLGGLSVMAELDSAIRANGCFRNVNLIFCNALAEKNYGYNSMSGMEEKAAVFSKALEGMIQWYSPDIILIACNTLSVVYPETAFARHPSVPVIGIVDLGVEEIEKALQKDPRAAAIILGTPTTIAANKHKEKLIARGIASDRIITRACKNLESEIQENAESEAVSASIAENLAAALSGVADDADTIVVGLCCTHYGYSLKTFTHVGSKVAKKPIHFIDPNAAMTHAFLNTAHHSRRYSPAMTVKVVSRVPVTESEIRSLSGLLEKKSHASAEAMRNFELKRDLFPFTPTK